MECCFYIFYGLPIYVTIYLNVKKDKYVKALYIGAQSVQSLSRQYHDFKCY